MQSEDNVDFGDLSAAHAVRSAPSPLSLWEQPPPTSELVLPQGERMPSSWVAFKGGSSRRRHTVGWLFAHVPAHLATSRGLVFPAKMLPALQNASGGSLRKGCWWAPWSPYFPATPFCDLLLRIKRGKGAPILTHYPDKSTSTDSRPLSRTTAGSESRNRNL